MNRIETLEYPIPALREMLLNALIHRNYMGAPTQIRVYDNKMFVWNHGTLPEGITLNKLAQFHSSYPRNPILAEACFRGGYIDSWGSGIMKIVDACKSAGLSNPVIEEDGGGFIVKLFKDRFSEEELQKLRLNERQIDAILFFKNKGEITGIEYAKRYNIAERTAREDLSEIVEKKLLIKKGETKSVKYIYSNFVSTE
jgi:ATP-dependent DNA helicase RecG